MARKINPFPFSILIIIILLVLIFPLKGENILFILFKPIQKFVYELFLPQPIPQIEEINKIKAENIKLKVYEEENKILKKLLDFTTNYKAHLIVANVVGKRTEAGLVWYILDRGTKDGVQSNLAVVNEDGILIGTVVKVENSYSFLRPVFDSRSLIAADIISTSEFQNSDRGQTQTVGVSQREVSVSQRTSGLVQGEYGLSLRMEYVPRDKKVKVGDPVITSGLTENIRRGIVIGEVASIEKKPNAAFQEIVVKPLFSLSDIRIVGIMK